MVSTFPAVLTVIVISALAQGSDGDICPPIVSEPPNRIPCGFVGPRYYCSGKKDCTEPGTACCKTACGTRCLQSGYPHQRDDVSVCDPGVSTRPPFQSCGFAPSNDCVTRRDCRPFHDCCRTQCGIECLPSVKQ